MRRGGWEKSAGIGRGNEGRPEKEVWGGDEKGKRERKRLELRMGVYRPGRWEEVAHGSQPVQY